MNLFTRKTAAVDVERVKRILSAAAMPIRERLGFWRRVMQSAFAKETATINIEGSNVRFLVTKGKSVERWESVSLAPGDVREGLILNPLAVSAVITELIASKRLKKGKVIASLSGSRSVHRIVDLP